MKAAAGAGFRPPPILPTGWCAHSGCRSAQAHHVTGRRRARRRARTRSSKHLSLAEMQSVEPRDHAKKCSTSSASKIRCAAGRAMAAPRRTTCAGRRKNGRNACEAKSEADTFSSAWRVSPHVGYSPRVRSDSGSWDLDGTLNHPEDRVAGGGLLLAGLLLQVA